MAGLSSGRTSMFRTCVVSFTAHNITPTSWKTVTIMCIVTPRCLLSAYFLSGVTLLHSIQFNFDEFKPCKLRQKDFILLKPNFPFP
jgi:hypothetical protein